MKGGLGGGRGGLLNTSILFLLDFCLLILIRFKKSEINLIYTYVFYCDKDKNKGITNITCKTDYS